ncbi:thiaminase II/PqqC family protein [Actinoallomurus soli]|uniref:hypothetical protein n=1 Tax=Actinoallomurus soli TaxID=2952535 RepID=UPI00209266F4|nr:hypothetical protein [Actinoallomurus soli]MCO5968865.1 hypothetical protein [Actinoallomurus soli]
MNEQHGDGRIVPERPLLLAEHRRVGDAIELRTATETFDVEPAEGLTVEQLAAVLGRLDGGTPLTEIAARTEVPEGTLRDVLVPAQVAGLLDEGAPAVGRHPLAVLADVEHVLNELMEELIFDGPFWQAVVRRPESLPPSVFHGFGLENWFFLFHENEFDSAILALPQNAGLRTLANEFYQEEHKHDDIVVRAFSCLGITKDDLLRSRPLPTTTALIRMLSWWARTDPLFFMATIGVLEGRLNSEGDAENAAYDSFLEACGKADLDPEFVEPLRMHAKINAAHDHGSVSRELFSRLPGLDAATEARLIGKAHLFVEAYAAFFNGILDYYGDPARPLLRPAYEGDGR